MAYELIGSVVLASPASFIDFDGIPQDGRALHIVASTASEFSNNTDNLRMYLNKNSANVAMHQVSASGSSLGDQELNIPGMNAAQTGAQVSNRWSSVKCLIDNYTTTAYSKPVCIPSVASVGISSNTLTNLSGNVLNTDSSAVSSLRFVNSSGANFQSGSAIYLYKIY